MESRSIHFLKLTLKILLRICLLYIYIKLPSVNSCLQHLFSLNEFDVYIISMEQRCTGGVPGWFVFLEFSYKL